MTIKKIFSCLILLVSAVLCIQSARLFGDWLTYAGYVGWALSFVLAGFCFYYIHKKSTLVVALLLVSLCSPMAFAGQQGAQQAAQKSQAEISQYAQEVCQAIGSGEGSDGALSAASGLSTDSGGSYEYSESLYNKAVAVSDYYSKSEHSGQASAGIGKTNLLCAQRYIDHVSKLKQTAKTSCSPLSVVLQYAFERKSCWPCDVTALLLNSIQSMAVSAHSVVNQSALALLGIIFIFWLTITILVMFSKFGFERFSEVFTKILHQTILVIVIALILNGPVVTIYKYVISPLILITTDLTIYFAAYGQENIGSGSIAQKAIQFLHLNLASATCDYCDKANAVVTLDDITTVGQFMDSRSLNGILCLVCTVYKQLSPMIALGQVLTCLSTAAPTALSSIPFLSGISLFSMPNIPMMMAGYMIIIVFTILMFLVGVLAMGSVMRLGFVLILMPLFIVAFAFKFSRSYAANAFKLILHALITLMILSLAISLLMIGFNALLPEASLTGLLQTMISSSPTAIADLISPPTPNPEDADMMHMVGKVANASTTFSLFLMVAYAFIAISVVGESATLAERFINAWINVSSMNQLTGAMGSAIRGGVSAAKGAGTLTTMAMGAAAAKVAQTVSGNEESKAAKAAKKYQEGSGEGSKPKQSSDSSPKQPSK